MRVFHFLVPKMHVLGNGKLFEKLAPLAAVLRRPTVGQQICSSPAMLNALERSTDLKNDNSMEIQIIESHSLADVYNRVSLAN
jgi:hypothetical protein